MSPRNPEAVLLHVRVQPKARANAVKGWHGAALRVSVTAAPEDGKANRAVIDLLAETFDLAPQQQRHVPIVKCDAPRECFREVVRFVYGLLGQLNQLDKVRVRYGGVATLESPESERGFLEQAWRFVFETRTHNSLVYPAEDVHRRLNVDGRKRSRLWQRSQVLKWGAAANCPACSSRWQSVQRRNFILNSVSLPLGI